MARRFKRRKPRVVWLPVFGDTFTGEAGTAATAVGVQFQCQMGLGQYGIVVDAAPLTFDGSQDPTINQSLGLNNVTLNDYVNGQAYRLRRIVGKIWCAASANPGDTATNITAIEVGFGFIVAKTDATGNITTDISTTNPLSQSSADDPWIWRRTWVLNPYDGTGSFGNADQWYGFPRTNMEYGSVADGPHIDQKTARVVGQEERLIGMLAARVLGTSDDASPTPTTEYVNVRGFLDYRLLASMRSTQGNRNNASR